MLIAGTSGRRPLCARLFVVVGGGIVVVVVGGSNNRHNLENIQNTWHTLAMFKRRQAKTFTLCLALCQQLCAQLPNIFNNLQSVLACCARAHAREHAMSAQVFRKRVSKFSVKSAPSGCPQNVWFPKNWCMHGCVSFFVCRDVVKCV